MIVLEMPNERTDQGAEAANRFAGWLVGRMAQRNLKNNHLASAMTARGLKISKSMVSSYRNGASLPDPESSDKLADFFGDDRSLVWGYVREARQLREEPAERGGEMHEFIRLTARLTAQEMVDAMKQGRDRLPPGGPHDDPVARRMMAELAASFEEMNPEQIEAAYACVMDAMRRLRRTENEVSSGS